jgi:hypothetical protein
MTVSNEMVPPLSIACSICASQAGHANRSKSKSSGEGRGLAASRAFADGLPAPASGKGGNFRYEPLCLIGIGIEVVADPFRKFGMSLMSRILDGGEEFSIAPGATAVFGRATAGDFDEARIELSRRGIGELLDLDCVLPTVMSSPCSRSAARTWRSISA